MYMDIRKIVMAIVLTISFSSLVACGQIARFSENDTTLSDSRAVVRDTDEDISQDASIEDSDESYVEEEPFEINNTVEEIIKRLEAAVNGDRVGRFNGKEIYAFKYPELTLRPMLYSESGVLVRYDDYLCVKYEPEKDNEEYIVLVYYFNSENKWESWYKYTVAMDVDEAKLIAAQEMEKGYTVWTDDRVVMQGEIFSEATIEEPEFLASFKNEIINFKD